MNGSCGTCSTAGRRGERGESRLKFLVTIAVIAIIAYVGYQYVPVAMQAYKFKDFMQQTVDKAVALGQSVEWAKGQLEANRKDYDVPNDATVTTRLRDGRMEARVQFTRPVQLPFYTYEYNFDHTVKSVDLMTVK
jgi:hypothetical protein